MDEPSSWVVGREAHNEPSSRREKGGVATRWIVELQARFATIPNTRTLTDDIVI